MTNWKPRNKAFLHIADEISIVVKECLDKRNETGVELDWDKEKQPRPVDKQVSQSISPFEHSRSSSQPTDLHTPPAPSVTPPEIPVPEAPTQPLDPVTPPPIWRKLWRKRNIVLLLLIICLILTGGGSSAVYYFSTRPQPVIVVTSKYRVGSTSAGSTSTTFQVKGQDFTHSSAITFLLDGKWAPGSQTVHSDSHGNVTALLTVTNGWLVGDHTLAARDASGYLTQKLWKIKIVVQGQASTPGPNGAPTDTATGTITVNIPAHKSISPTTYKLSVTRRSNRETICRYAKEDLGFLPDGRIYTLTGTTSKGTFYTDTLAATCSGTYINGMLRYTETVTNEEIEYADAGFFTSDTVCTALSPYVNISLEGTFIGSTAIKGRYSYGTSQPVYHCTNDDGNWPVPPQEGTWSGTASMQS